jgi:hypothetical protein
MWYSVYGPITVGERIWRDPGSSYQRLLPKALGICSRGCSRPLQRVLTDFGSDQSFAKATQKVQEHYGFEINPSAVRKATLKCAQKVAHQLADEATDECRALPSDSAPTMIVQADGSMVCIRPAGPRQGPRPLHYEEIRLAAAQAQGSTETTYAASFESVDDLGQRWGPCAKAAGRGIGSPIHALGDGAGWILRQVEEVFGPRATFLCDFFHVTEYLRGAALSCREKAPDQWRRTQQRRLKSNALEKVIQELETKLEADVVANDDAPVRAAHRYLDNRRDQFDYAGALAQDLPIGSGLIESGNKHVLQARLKLPGSSWLKENAADMAQLRVFRSNRRWTQLWN